MPSLTPAERAALASFNTPRKILRRWFLDWPHYLVRELRKLSYLPGYLSGDHRPHYRPTVPTLLLGRRLIYTMERWNLPELRISVMDGMGEHYGYPRHQLLLVLWWARRGYAFGLSFEVPSTSPTDH